jgi:UPF0716 family protein affecting phage T7 exclusion
MGRLIQIVGFMVFVVSTILLLAGFATGSTGLSLILGMIGMLITVGMLYVGRRMTKSSEAREAALLAKW